MKVGMRILVTGCAGFIGFHVVTDLIKNNSYQIVGIDSLNTYYSKKLKLDRLIEIKKRKSKNFKFIKLNLTNANSLESIFKTYKFDIVINLAAQAGVRYSLINPKAYIQSNILGFYNILELSSKYKIKHLVFASSSSVYGETNKFPLKEDFLTDKPIQLYAATKKSNELFAHSYSYLYKLKVTGLRFFTVYGPWGRPDMSLFKFVDNIYNGKPIEIFNKGNHVRDFTYIDDIVRGIKIASLHKDNKNLFKIFNIGSDKPIKLINYINLIEKKLNMISNKKYLKLQKGDIYKTHANINSLKKIGYHPRVSVNKGIDNYIKWYLSYYKKK